MLDPIAASQDTAFQLRGSLFTLSVLQLQQTELDKVARDLKTIVRQAPKFFECAPIVVDLALVHSTEPAVNFPELVTVLRDQGLIPVGVRGGTTAQHNTAKQHGLAILSSAKTEEPTLATRQKANDVSEPVAKVKTQKASEKAQAPAPEKTRKNLVINRPVRSGQQVYAPDGDLVIVGSVSQGAELLADGNIHVYGPLRGRALAGINGNTTARIFCQSMDAELISIAGRYIVNDAIKKQSPNEPQQIFLQEGKLMIETL